jgi:2'-5' RNA ligase
MRPLAIELGFDAQSDRRLRQLWSRLATLHRGSTRSELGIRPHVTLALFRDQEPEGLSGVAASLARELAPFPLALTMAGRFPGSEGVVYLKPAACAELDRAHATLDRLLAGARDLVHAYYRPGAWQPHCTMALGVPAASRDVVLAVCRAPGAVGAVRIEGVQVVRYRPATEITRIPLEHRPA